MCGFLAEFDLAEQLLTTPEEFATELALSKGRGMDYTSVIRERTSR